MTANFSVLCAALCLSLVYVGTGAFAQQAFDPMRPAANPLMPATPDASIPESGTPAAAPNPDLGNLPDGVGAEDTYYQCIACHSTAIIRQQRLTDARWDYLWTWMVKEQGMYEPDDETRDLVLAYLKTNFSSER